MTTEVLEWPPASSASGSSRRIRGIEGQAVCTWLLAGGLVLYLGIDGGGYDILVRSRASVIVWWLVLVGAAWGLLPAGRLSRGAWVALGLFGGFVIWTLVATTWSLSSERSLQELSRVASYLGVLVLAVAIHRDRERAVRHTLQAVSAAIMVVVVLALISRLLPNVLPGSHTTAAFLPGARARLSWPLNYWNALAALVALGLPLLLAIATSARPLAAQAAVAAALPLLVLCDYLTLSRGGAVASVLAVLAFLALAPHRLPKLATVLVAGAGSALLVAEAAQRRAVQQGLAGHAATAQGRQLFLWAILTCGGVAVAQVGVGLAGRRLKPGWVHISPAVARPLVAGAVAVILVAAVVAGAPSRLDYAWQQFKRPSPAVLQRDSLARYGSISSDGRYDIWRVAVKSAEHHLLGGNGPGTFQFLWERRAPYFISLVNAHSLYFETLAEIGLVGLALLLGFFVVVLRAALLTVAMSAGPSRTLTAGLAAALLAFAVSASVDWVWQVPALPAAFLLLAAAALAPVRWSAQVPRARAILRAGLLLAAIACLVAIALPMATVSKVAQSQASAARGGIATALAQARAAARLEPDAATPQLQEALVLELAHNLPAALAAARTATNNEPSNWSTWLVLSRLEAESGHVLAAINAYQRARIDNPRSPVFR